MTPVAHAVRASKNVPAIVGALLVVYVLWGSTAPAIKVAVATIPPFYMASIRFLIAGGILWLYCRVRGVPLPSARDWARRGDYGHRAADAR